MARKRIRTLFPGVGGLGRQHAQAALQLGILDLVHLLRRRRPCNPRDHSVTRSNVKMNQAVHIFKIERDG